MAFRIRDPIHNFVLIPDEFLGIVNCGALQRLRGIKQLALASLAYPGALHTRFDHTLGVTHVAGMMADALRSIDPDEKRFVQMAALLHDVGHGPFSHVSESSLSRFADPSSLKAGQKAHKIHELVTAEIIRTDAELCQLLSEEDREKVIALLNEGTGRPALRQIVSGPSMQISKTTCCEIAASVESNTAPLTFSRCSGHWSWWAKVAAKS